MLDFLKRGGAKGWNLIQRFWEDIDIFLDPLAYQPPLGKRAIDRELKRLRDAVAAHPALTFVEGESQTIGGFGRNDRFVSAALRRPRRRLRPEECFRMRPENVRDGNVEIQYGKTENARRRIPMTPRVNAILEMRLAKAAGSEWLFPAPTRSGHIEPSSLKRQHAKAIDEATAISGSRPNGKTPSSWDSNCTPSGTRA